MPGAEVVVVGVYVPGHAVAPRSNVDVAVCHELDAVVQIGFVVVVADHHCDARSDHNAHSVRLASLRAELSLVVAGRDGVIELHPAREVPHLLWLEAGRRYSERLDLQAFEVPPHFGKVLAEHGVKLVEVLSEDAVVGGL